MSLLKHRPTASSTTGQDGPLTASANVRVVPLPVSDEQVTRDVAIDPATTLHELLLAIASGDQEASAALESRVGGLVRANIRRVLRDASRSDAVTQQFFAEVPGDAGDFDPHRDSAQAWLLMRAHQRATSGLTPERTTRW